MLGSIETTDMFDVKDAGLFAIQIEIDTADVVQKKDGESRKQE